MSAEFRLPRRSVEIQCSVDIEQTAESFHAHAVPEGVDIRPGDIVLLHDVPTHVAFGERVSCQCRATVLRAGWAARAWTRITALIELTELYEVGFAPKEAS
jgi:hypothetical protein